MTIKGSKLLSNTWKQELQILEDEVCGEVLRVGKRNKMHLSYENIAQVNISRGVLTADIEIINKGGSGNLIIKSVNKSEAEKAKALIDQKKLNVRSEAQSQPTTSSADEIKKFAELRDQKIISEEEFENKKKSILGL
ncbi:MAG: SHOCT domain-containing protein [Candidatus Babeliales bacterium]